MSQEFNLEICLQSLGFDSFWDRQTHTHWQRKIPSDGSLKKVSCFQGCVRPKSESKNSNYVLEKRDLSLAAAQGMSRQEPGVKRGAGIQSQALRSEIPVCQEDSEVLSQMRIATAWILMRSISLSNCKNNVTQTSTPTNFKGVYHLDGRGGRLER